MTFDIIVDSREASKSGRKGGKKIYERLLEHKDINVKVEYLGECVDFALPSKEGITHLIQRKTALEMVKHDAIFEDIVGMCMIESSIPYLLVEGSLNQIHAVTKWREEPICGTICTILQKFPTVRFIPSGGISWTSNILIQFAKQLGRTGEKTVRQLGYSVDLSLEPHEQARSILETFPHISVTLSERILEREGDLITALNNVDDWINIPRIGESLIEKTKKILYAKYQKS